MESITVHMLYLFWLKWWNIPFCRCTAPVAREKHIKEENNTKGKVHHPLKLTGWCCLCVWWVGPSNCRPEQACVPWCCKHWCKLWPKMCDFVKKTLLHCLQKHMLRTTQLLLHLETAQLLPHPEVLHSHSHNTQHLPHLDTTEMLVDPEIQQKYWVFPHSEIQHCCSYPVRYMTTTQFLPRP